MTAEENLQQLGIALPEPPAPTGSYNTWVRAGNLITTSGQMPIKNKVMQWPGRIGVEVNTADGYQAARIAGINAIAQLKAAAGDLEKIQRIIRLDGFVHCSGGFRDHPKVLDGASDLMNAVFGERGRHVRIEVGIAEMPMDACIQLAVWAEVRD